MGTAESLWEWLNHNAGAVGIIIALVPIFWAVVEYVRKARSERVQQRYLNYHHLVAEVVGRDDGAKMFLDRQLAAIYELQKYPEYKSPTLKILASMQAKANSEPERYAALIAQIDETVSSLKR